MCLGITASRSIVYITVSYSAGVRWFRPSRVCPAEGRQSQTVHFGHPTQRNGANAGCDIRCRTSVTDVSREDNCIRVRNSEECDRLRNPMSVHRPALGSDVGSRGLAAHRTVAPRRVVLQRDVSRGRRPSAIGPNVGCDVRGQASATDVSREDNRTVVRNSEECGEFRNPISEHRPRPTACVIWPVCFSQLPLTALRPQPAEIASIS